MVLPIINPNNRIGLTQLGLRAGGGGQQAEPALSLKWPRQAEPIVTKTLQQAPVAAEVCRFIFQGLVLQDTVTPFKL